MSFNSINFINISQAFIQIGDSYLMQLRDLKPTIVYPGHWGFFAGHCKKNESPLETMWRELSEELEWQPETINELGNIVLDGNRIMHAHHCQLNIKISQLTLNEGIEIGEFKENEIIEGKLFSKKLDETYDKIVNLDNNIAAWIVSNLEFIPSLM